jgi:hypothetical protein
MSRFVAPPLAPPPFGLSLGTQVSLSSRLSYFSNNITIFSINDTFYVIQFLYSPADHDGGSSSHRNEPTPRDNSGHSNQPCVSNTWAICMVTCPWCGANWSWWIWWLCDEFDDFVMNIMTLWWIWWLCDEYHDFVMSLMTLWCIMHFCDLWIEPV